MGCTYHFLKNTLKFTNALLLLLGLVASIFSLYLLLEFRKQERTKEEMESPPPPAPTGISPPPSPEGMEVLAGEPWFLYAFGGAGLYITLTAAAGLCGAEHANRCCLGIYNYMLCLLLLGQGALAIAIFTKSDFVHMPEDITGSEEKAWKFIHKNLPVVQYFSISVLVVQLMSAILAMALSNAAKHAQYDSDDEEDYYERHYGGTSATRRPLLPRGDGEEQPGSATRHDTWSRRMREKYGLETSEFGYDPVTGRSPARGPPPRDEDEGKGGCAVM